MKLIQLNCWMLRLENQVYDFLESQSADIICLQEAISTKGDPGIIGSVERVQAKTNCQSVYFSPVISFSNFGKFSLFGNAVLSRYSFTNKNTFFTNLAYKENFSFDNDDYNIRNFQHVVVNADGKKIHLLNHHGFHVPNHKAGNKETMRQMKQIGEYIDRLEGPIILTGDFNLSPHSESLELLNERLTNLSIEQQIKTTRTNLTHKTEVCDYIFVNDAVKVQGFYASDEVVSDHKALILEFDV